MKTQLAFANEEPLFRRLENIAKYSALTRDQKIQYDDSFNNYMAYIGQVRYQWNRGMEEGRAEGERSKAIAIARSLKASGLDAEFIAKNTGLSISEINTL